MNVVRAAENWQGVVSDDVATISSFESLFKNVIQAVVALAGVAILVMFFVAGFNYLFSGGDPKKLEQAKGTLTNAIIGLVIIVAAYIVLNLIRVFTGVDVTTFKITFF